MKKVFISALFILSCLVGFSQDSSYVFATSAKILACGDAFLQKVSEDNIADLNIELVISKIPNNKKLNVEDNRGMVNGLFIKYAAGNSYVAPLCTDAKSSKTSKPAVATYRLVSGSFKVVQHKDNNAYYSIEFKNLVFRDDNGSKIILIKENFDRIKLGWLPG